VIHIQKTFAHISFLQEWFADVISQVDMIHVPD
jgi:hypothetical protein